MRARTIVGGKLCKRFWWQERHGKQTAAIHWWLAQADHCENAFGKCADHRGAHGVAGVLNADFAPAFAAVKARNATLIAAFDSRRKAYQTAKARA